MLRPAWRAHRTPEPRWQAATRPCASSGSISCPAGDVLVGRRSRTCGPPPGTRHPRSRTDRRPRDGRGGTRYRSGRPGDIRMVGADLTDRRQIVRLVQRGQRHELLEAVQHRVVHQGRCCEIRPTMHDPVADRAWRQAARPATPRAGPAPRASRRPGPAGRSRRSGPCRRHPWPPDAAWCRSSAWPRASSSRSPPTRSNSWNLMLDEPALTTSSVSTTPVTPRLPWRPRAAHGHRRRHRAGGHPGADIVGTAGQDDRHGRPARSRRRRRWP